MILNSRRTFLKTAFLGSAVLVMSANSLFGAVLPMHTIEMAQDDLFGHAKKLGVKSDLYMSIILNHSRVSSTEKEFLRNGAQWLNEEAVLLHGKMYADLSSGVRQNLLKRISLSKWGEEWIYTILTYTMEAIFSDEVYGVNKNRTGDKWLDFEAGFPRPKEAYL